MNSTDLSPLSSRALGEGTSAPLARATPEAVPRVREVGRQRLRAPRGFRSIKGLPTDVRFGGVVPTNVGRSPAQKEGLRYEQKVQDVLSSVYGSDYTVSPSILYRDRLGLRRAIPDGLLRLGDTLVIVEIKLTHCERAWWQLMRLYVPLLQRIETRARIAPVEICRSYDPAVSFPSGQVIESLHRTPIGVPGVLQWRL